MRNKIVRQDIERVGREKTRSEWKREDEVRWKREDEKENQKLDRLPRVERRKRREGKREDQG